MPPARAMLGGSKSPVRACRHESDHLAIWADQWTLPVMPQNCRADAPAMAGVVTFLFTDVEGSTRLWDEQPERMKPALAAHDALARRAVESRRGTVVKTTGDGIHAAFDDPLDALAATVELQRALADSAATHGVSLSVRCGLHAGVV